MPNSRNYLPNKVQNFGKYKISPLKFAIDLKNLAKRRNFAKSSHIIVNRGAREKLLEADKKAYFWIIQKCSFLCVRWMVLLMTSAKTAFSVVFVELDFQFETDGHSLACPHRTNSRKILFIFLFSYSDPQFFTALCFSLTGIRTRSCLDTKFVGPFS